LVGPTKSFAAWIYSVVDRTVIDGTLHTIARSAQAFAFANRGFDRRVVNGFADQVSNWTQEFGRSFRQIQSGFVQNYLFLALVNALVLVIVYLALFQ
jgi:NADH:ubiquinone oxidoreductase subunit 5 (subunit L)/multisubunit Na+/H+ antiporter MnhA subunit